MNTFVPEGVGFLTPENQKYTASVHALKEAFRTGRILEAKAVRCDREYNLYVQFPGVSGVIPREECALGICEGTVRDIAILSRVNKPVCFVVTAFCEKGGKEFAVLSRRKVQEQCMAQYISKLVPGDVIDAVVTRMEPFGAFCDIGAGISALLPIDAISVSRIPHPNVRFYTGQKIRVVVKGIDELGRITLSHKELLGTWAENAAKFSAGETVPGIVRSIEKYGIFVELAPNLAGLAEYVPGVCPGDAASVYIKSIHPDRMKIKLILVDHFAADAPDFHYRYPAVSHIDRWLYSSPESEKVIESVFSV